jgi:cytochrome P450
MMATDLFQDTMNRFRFITFSIYPELLPYQIFSECRRLKRNVASMRATLLKIMEARRSGKVQGDIDGDLLSIILSDELYR